MIDFDPNPHSCCFDFPNGNNQEENHMCHINQPGGLDKYKECINCVHYEPFYERYRCHHEDGFSCLSLNLNHFQKK